MKWITLGSTQIKSATNEAGIIQNIIEVWPVQSLFIKIAKFFVLSCIRSKL